MVRVRVLRRCAVLRRLQWGIWVLSLVGSVLPSLPAQQPAVVACRECGSDGVVECGRHGKGGLLRERGVRHCSVASDCKTCAGVLDVDCRYCRHANAERTVQERRELVQAWRQGLGKRIDAVAKGEPMLHLQTEHVDLSFGVDKLTVGRDKIDAHAAMHLYGERIEQLRAELAARLGLGDADFSARLHIYVCRNAEQSRLLSPHVTGLGGALAVGSKQMGIDAVLCTWQDPRTLPDDAALHRHIVHNTVHLLLSNMAPSGWFGNPGNGWLDEGLAHWFEDRVDGKCTNFCFTEVLLASGQGFKAGRWRVPVRKMADAGQFVSLAALSPKNTDQLTFVEHAQSFAMVDYLLTFHGGTKVRELLRQLKTKVPAREALPAVFGCGVLEFDTEFATWVKATYPQQESAR